VRASPPKNHVLVDRRSGALVAVSVDGITRFVPGVPDAMKRTTPDKLAALVRVLPVARRKRSA
jgi:hypothetical protein